MITWQGCTKVSPFLVPIEDVLYSGWPGIETCIERSPPMTSGVADFEALFFRLAATGVDDEDGGDDDFACFLVGEACRIGKGWEVEPWPRRPALWLASRVLFSATTAS